MDTIIEIYGKKSEQLYNKYNYESLDTYCNEKLLLFKKFPKIINLLKETIYIRIHTCNSNIYSIEDLLIYFLLSKE